MSHFTFRAEFDNDRSVEIVPDYVHPLGTEELAVLAADASSPLKLKIEGGSVLLDGIAKDGRATVTATINFAEKTSIFALVPGGWLPLPCVIPPRFLVDRNVVINLRDIRLGTANAEAKSIEWWTKLLDSNGSAVFNPLPFAFEAGFRRKPTMSEFRLAYEEGAHEIRHALPSSKVVTLGELGCRAGYKQLETFDQRAAKEVAFLQEVSPLNIATSSRQRQEQLSTEVLRLADKHHLTRGSLPVLIALSCVYEDMTGSTRSIGRRLLKPSAKYSEADAFNAISDLRHIEIAAAGQVYFQDESFSLCTSDKGLAMLWSALSLRGESLPNDSIEFTVDLTPSLFARLSAPEIEHLRNRLQ